MIDELLARCELPPAGTAVSCAVSGGADSLALLALGAELGLIPIADPSNDDAAHRRNRVRHGLVPLLDDIAARDVAAVLARQAGLLADDADALDELARAVDPTDAAALVAAPIAV